MPQILQTGMRAQDLLLLELAHPFTGTFNGNSYTISNLYIDIPSTNDVGLFGYTSGATIENVGLINVNITGEN